MPLHHCQKVSFWNPIKHTNVCKLIEIMCVSTFSFHPFYIKYKALTSPVLLAGFHKNSTVWPCIWRFSKVYFFPVLMPQEKILLQQIVRCKEGVKKLCKYLLVQLHFTKNLQKDVHVFFLTNIPTVEESLVMTAEQRRTYKEVRKSETSVSTLSWRFSTVMSGLLNNSEC